MKYVKSARESNSILDTYIPTMNSISVFRTVSSIREFRRNALLASQTVGLIPTMGALHAGHISLIRLAAETHPTLVVSIFVNPAQFAPHEDLDAYPRTFDSDMRKLEDINVDLERKGLLGRVKAVFAPEVREMYPDGIPLEESKQSGAFVTVQPLSAKLEGGTRPHFFRGVATIVTKLFNIVQPEQAFFGQKDVQQCVILKRVVRDLMIPTEIVVGKTVREDDGLAMSSRNVYLKDKRRQVAPIFYKALRAGEEVVQEAKTAGKLVIERDAVLNAVKSVLDGAGQKEGVNVQIEYLSLADVKTLDEVDSIDLTNATILSGALRLGPTTEEENWVRIIDNIILGTGVL